MTIPNPNSLPVEMRAVADGLFIYRGFFTLISVSLIRKDSDSLRHGAPTSPAPATRRSSSTTPATATGGWAACPAADSVVADE
jgi:hypothetical protein